MNDKPRNDNTTPAYDKARRNFDSGKSPEQTRRDLNTQKRAETVKPVGGKK